MTIAYEGHGDIFNCGADYIVCPVNTVGVMGAGIAYKIKDDNPKLFELYRKGCKRHPFLKPGELRVYPSDCGTYKVVCLPTKTTWKAPSKIEYVNDGLQAFKEWALTDPSIEGKRFAFPPLGCGKGGLDYDTEVRPLMFKHLSDLNVKIQLLNW